MFSLLLFYLLDHKIVPHIDAIVVGPTYSFIHRPLSYNELKPFLYIAYFGLFSLLTSYRSNKILQGLNFSFMFIIF